MNPAGKTNAMVTLTFRSCIHAGRSTQKGQMLQGFTQNHDFFLDVKVGDMMFLGWESNTSIIYGK